MKNITVIIQRNLLISTHHEISLKVLLDKRNFACLSFYCVIFDQASIHYLSLERKASWHSHGKNIFISNINFL